MWTHVSPYRLALVSIHRRFPGLRVSLWHLTAIAAQLCVLRPQPGLSPPCPSDLRARLESLGIWAYGASPGHRAAHQRGCWAGSTSARRQTACVVLFKNRLKIYLFRRCYETAWLLLHFPFLVIVSPLRNSGPCDSFDYLGHSKNVVDDDDDD